MCSAKLGGQGEELRREEIIMMPPSNSRANLYHIKCEHPASETIEKNQTRKERQDETRKPEIWNENVEGESRWFGNLR